MTLTTDDMKPPVLIAVLISVIAAGCSPRLTSRAPGSRTIEGASSTLVVRGSYAAVDLDRVDRLSLEGGKVVLHGSSLAVAVDLPASADPAKPDPHWALVTESDNGGSRVLTFTHDNSLDEFTIELPASDAPIRYGGVSGRDGNDVLVLAWGEHFRSYHAELTIARATRPAGGSSR